MNNYGNFQDYPDNYENSNENYEKQLVVIEKRRPQRSSLLKSKFQSFLRIHWNEFKYTVLGLVLALLFLTIGFFRTLLIVILLALGNIYGKAKDGDPKTLMMLERFFYRY